jgi:SpoVK/Ycf46/Vps4 family AAA+-type ATPase
MAKIFSKDSITVIILVAVILLALGYSINSLLFQGVKFDIGDSEAELAQKWLTQSTNSPESCRKLTANSEQWFDEFLKNRKSLGPLKTRFLKSKQQITKKKQHLVEIVFESSFTNARRLDEVVTIRTDKNRERLVAGIDYRYRLKNPQWQVYYYNIRLFRLK